MTSSPLYKYSLDRFRRHLLTALLLGACSLSIAPVAFSSDTELPKARDKWIRLDGPLFTLYSAAPAKQAGEVSRALEQYHAILSGPGKAEQLPAPVPMKIFLFRDERAMAPYGGFAGDPAQAGSGYFLQREDVHYIAVNAGTALTETIYHEYAHSILTAIWPGAPLWMQEGLAEYYSTFRIDGKFSYAGEAIKEHLAILRSRSWIPCAELMQMNTDAPAYRETDKNHLYYAQSWLLTHYLLHGAPRGGAAAMGRYAAATGAGMDQMAALEQVFNLTPASLDQALRTYAGSKTLERLRLDAPRSGSTPAPASTAVPYEEILCELGDLLAHHGSARHPAAQAHYAKALQINSRFAPAHAGLGYIATVAEDEATALTHFRQALRLDDGSSLIQYQYGRCLLEKGRKQEKDEREGTLTEAREALQRALTLDPRRVEALAQLGQIHMLLGMQPEGRVVLERALAAMPARMDVARNLLQYYVLADEAQKQAELLALIRQRGGRAEAEAASETILRSKVDRVARLINDKRYDEALAAAEKLASQTDDPAIKALIAEARQAASQGQLVEIYNQGVRQAADKKYDQAEKLFARVVKEGGKSELADQARANIAKIRVARQAAWYNQAFDLMRANDFNRAVPLLEKVIRDGSDPQTTRAAENALGQIRAL